MRKVATAGPSLAIRDARPRGSRGLEYREAWSFKGPTERLLRDLVKDAPRPLYHVFCGKARLAPDEIRVDLHHPSADIKADAKSLPFSDAQTIVADPPWGIKVTERTQFCYGLWRALRPGGVLYLYSNWAPPARLFHLQRVWVRTGAFFQDTPMPPVLLQELRKPLRGERKAVPI